MASSVKRKFDKYWGNIENQNMLLYVAVVLDPRYKMKYVAFCLHKLYSEDEVQTIMDSIKGALGKLVTFYAENESDKQGGTTSRPRFPVVDPDEDDTVNIFKFGFEKEYFQDNATEMKNELERYLAEPNEDIRNKTFDILAWWKISSTKYHVMSLIARDVLAIQVSTVASELAFSTGGRVLDCFQSSLSPSIVEALICC